jgi:hypothetical protein
MALNNSFGETPDLPRAQAASEKQGSPGEARDLFERMAGEAVRQSEVERKEAKSRRPVTRILLALTIAASLLAAATMFYGIYYFPDAPIRQTSGGYAGKGGGRRTQGDFEAFLRWQKATLVVFPLVFGFGFAFGLTEVMQKRKTERS